MNVDDLKEILESYDGNDGVLFVVDGTSYDPEWVQPTLAPDHAVVFQGR